MWIPSFLMDLVRVILRMKGNGCMYCLDDGLDCSISKAKRTNDPQKSSRKKNVEHIKNVGRKRVKILQKAVAHFEG